MWLIAVQIALAVLAYANWVNKVLSAPRCYECVVKSEALLSNTFSWLVIYLQCAYSNTQCSTISPTLPWKALVQQHKVHFYVMPSNFWDAWTIEPSLCYGSLTPGSSQASQPHGHWGTARLPGPGGAHEGLCPLLLLLCPQSLLCSISVSRFIAVSVLLLPTFCPLGMIPCTHHLLPSDTAWERFLKLVRSAWRTGTQAFACPIFFANMSQWAVTNTLHALFYR